MENQTMQNGGLTPIMTLAVVLGLSVLTSMNCSTRNTEDMAQNTDNINLESHRWKSRLILLFAPSEDDPRYQSQVEQFYSEQEQVRDRDIILFELLGKDRRGADGAVSPNQKTDSLWERFDVSETEFAFILLGKDGGVKLRSDGPVPPSEVFSLIDSMPMRQEEMRRKKELEDPL